MDNPLILYIVGGLADKQDYAQIIGNMVERIERAKDPARKYVWDMRSRLAFRGIDVEEARALMGAQS